jgi:hypothetical protein
MVIKRIRSDDYNLDIQLLKEDGTIDGEPINLTGCTVFFTVKRNLQEPDSRALIRVDVSSHTDPVNGVTSIPLTASQCDLVGDFNYDVKVKYSTGTIESVMKDTIIFIDHVTIRTS